MSGPTVGKVSDEPGRSGALALIFARVAFLTEPVVIEFLGVGQPTIFERIAEHTSLRD